MGPLRVRGTSTWSAIMHWLIWAWEQWRTQVPLPESTIVTPEAISAGEVALMSQLGGGGGIGGGEGGLASGMVTWPLGRGRSTGVGTRLSTQVQVCNHTHGNRAVSNLLERNACTLTLCATHVRHLLHNIASRPACLHSQCLQHQSDV